MAGTSQGVKNSWATRRALYGPSGRAPTGGAKKQASHESKKAAPSRYMNQEKRDVRFLNGKKVPPDSQLESWGREREEYVAAVNRFNRYKKNTIYQQLPAYVRQSYEKAQRARLAEVNRLTRAITARQEMLLREDRKKHGRRYI